MKGKKNLDLHLLEQDLAYEFKDKDLLIKSLTHSSYANENKMKSVENNERLEFLGDSVLSLIVSQYLYKKYPYLPEGDLTKLRASVVCEFSLAYAAKKLDLGKYLRLGKGEESTGGRNRDSILADAMESLTGAIYIDSDFGVVSQLLIDNFEKDMVYAVTKGNLFIDFKTDLQERLQRDSNVSIDYRIIKETGPDHNKIFYIGVFVNNKLYGSGSGKNKKEAEQLAAKEALQYLEGINE